MRTIFENEEQRQAYETIMLAGTVDKTEELKDCYNTLREEIIELKRTIHDLYFWLAISDIIFIMLLGLSIWLN